MLDSESELDNYILDSTGLVHFKRVLQIEDISSALNEINTINTRIFPNHKPRKFGFLDESQTPQTFLRLLLPARLKRLLTSVLGAYFRLDSAFGLNQPYSSGTGENLHGGPGSGHGMHSFTRQAGKTYCGQLSVGIPLILPKDGCGLMYLPGSHKSDYSIEGGPVYEILKKHNQTDRLISPSIKLGDIVVFPEALIHGAMYVTSPRLFLYFMFTPGHVCYRRQQFNISTKIAAAALGLNNMISEAYVSGRDKYSDDEIRKPPTF